MNSKDYRDISKKAKEIKDKAISSTRYIDEYLEAEKLYNLAADLCSKDRNLTKTKREYLCLVYKYEALDCKYAYQIKKKYFNESFSVLSSQKEIIEEVLSKFKVEDFLEENLAKGYQYFKYYRIMNELKSFQTRARIYKEKEDYTNALYYFRRAEDVLARVDISSLEDGFLLSYNKNYHILRVNISQCQIGVYKSEQKKDELLNRMIIKGLLFGISETKKLLNLSGSDPTYEKGIIEMKNWALELLSSPETSWEELLKNNDDQELVDLMILSDNIKYINASGNIIIGSKEDRLLFYSHGFCSRGKWKDKFTRIVTFQMKKINISFTMSPWDYGTFIVQFVIPFARRRVIREFCEEYQYASDRYGKDLKKCLVAHSFATYITSKALQENPQMKFERIIYLGNILVENYNWDKLKDNNQIDRVYCEKSTNDRAVATAEVYREFIPWVNWLGCAGIRGFYKEYDYITFNESESGHSGMINEENMSGKWFNFLIS